MSGKVDVKAGAAPPDSWKIFDRIAGRYDLLNRLLSFGRDVAWRKRLCRCLPEGDNLRLLDLATGTADVLIALCEGSARVRSGVGMDRSAKMLAVGKGKLEGRRLGVQLRLFRGDAACLAIGNDSFDVATMAFGIRNVPKPPEALREIHRVLKPSGRALVLEFSLPSNRVFRALYLLYFRHVLPRVGGLISGDGSAYRYLNESVERFPYGRAFSEMMIEAGFTKVTAAPLSLGIATLYQGDK